MKPIPVSICSVIAALFASSIIGTPASAEGVPLQFSSASAILAQQPITPYQKSSADSTVLRNRDWTITVGNGKSWSGVNGTGNLTYRGCNSKGQCLSLTGGTVVCRDGTCTTSWRNGEYTYVLLDRMGETVSPSTLVIRRGDTIIQQIKGLRRDSTQKTRG